MRSMKFALPLACTLLLLSGCSQPPAQELEAAKQSMDRARNAQAADYAADSWTAATDAQARLDAEMQAQNARMAPFRGYAKAKALASEVQAAADKAAGDAEAALRQAKDDATRKMAEAHEAYDRVNRAREAAPKGKGTEADLASLKSDSMSIDETLQAMQAAFDAGRYKDALTKAEAAIAACKDLEAEIGKATRLHRSTMRS
jgi:hypothetical protein